MALRRPVYLDNHATTQPDPRVVDAMIPYFQEFWGNAASHQHQYGWQAEAGVEAARIDVARLIGASEKEIIFTSGATESINLAIKGAAAASRRRQLVTAATEHAAVLDTCRSLERRGWTVTMLPVDPSGQVSAEAVASAVTDETLLVSIMTANNEVGTVNRVADIGRVCRERGVLFHTDATQAVGRIPVDVTAMNADMMSFSAHKMYGPKGIGALYLRASHPRIHLVPLLDGGGHEQGLRSGTPNVPAVVGFGTAARIAREEMAGDAARTSGLRDMLVAGLLHALDDIRCNGHATERLPNNASITFRGARADALMMDMKDLALSSGSACSSASAEPSHVLMALGLSRDETLATLRFGLGRFTTQEEIEYALERIVETVRRHRTRTPLHAAHS